MPLLDTDIERVLLDATEIADLVHSLADRLTADYGDRDPLLVGALNGSVVFMADLMRQLRFPLSVDFVALSSYGCNSESRGEPVWTKRLGGGVGGRPVIVIEDIVDTGLTLACLRRALAEEGAASVAACALLDKPSRRQVDVDVEYVGQQIPDEFVVGYGLDYNQRFRNLPYVAVLSRKAYRSGVEV